MTFGHYIINIAILPEYNLDINFKMCSITEHLPEIMKSDEILLLQ